MKYTVTFIEPSFRRLMRFVGRGHVHILELALVLDGVLVQHTTLLPPWFYKPTGARTLRTIPFTKIVKVRPQEWALGSYRIHFLWPTKVTADLPGSFEERTTQVAFRVLERRNEFDDSFHEYLYKAGSANNQYPPNA